MAHQFAFAGFGHPHINTLYEHVRASAELELAGACEPDEQMRAAAQSRGVEFTHTSCRDLLDDVSCDVVAIGACFGARGAIAIEALRRGKHVIADKPLCTRMEELDEIESLTAASGLRVGCMLTTRGSRTFAGLRHLVREGQLGDIHAIAFGGQHPLNVDTRPAWYFEPGMHGGTINDIFIHAADWIPWITGLFFETVQAARCWNALAPQYPHFKDGAQMLISLSNGCGVVGDVSYFMPSKGGYSLPYYWRTTFFGAAGIAEVSATSDCIDITRDGAVVSIEPPGNAPEGYLPGFLSDLEGTATAESLRTDDVLRATRIALRVQQAADDGEYGGALA